MVPPPRGSGSAPAPERRIGADLVLLDAPTHSMESSPPCFPCRSPPGSSARPGGRFAAGWLPAGRHPERRERPEPPSNWQGRSRDPERRRRKRRNSSSLAITTFQLNCRSERASPGNKATSASELSGKSLAAAPGRSPRLPVPGRPSSSGRVWKPGRLWKPGSSARGNSCASGASSWTRSGSECRSTGGTRSGRSGWPRSRARRSGSAAPRSGGCGRRRRERLRSLRRAKAPAGPWPGWGWRSSGSSGAGSAPGSPSGSGAAPPLLRRRLLGTLPLLPPEPLGKAPWNGGFGGRRVPRRRMRFPGGDEGKGMGKTRGEWGAPLGSLPGSLRLPGALRSGILPPGSPWKWEQEPAPPLGLGSPPSSASCSFRSRFPPGAPGSRSAASALSFLPPRPVPDSGSRRESLGWGGQRSEAPRSPRPRSAASPILTRDNAGSARSRGRDGGGGSARRPFSRMEETPRPGTAPAGIHPLPSVLPDPSFIPVFSLFVFPPSPRKRRTRGGAACWDPHPRFYPVAPSSQKSPSHNSRLEKLPRGAPSQVEPLQLYEY